MKTAITELFGIEYPIMNAGMGRVALPKMVAAVSNAGGLGVLGCGSGAPELTREYIRQIRALTDKPFGGNAPLALPNGRENVQVHARGEGAGHQLLDGQGRLDRERPPTSTAAR